MEDHFTRPLDGRVLRDIAVVVGLTVAALLLGALTLRRRTD
jgi:hypothetical protein